MVRHIELVPQRARLVDAPEQWRWSGARGHIAGDADQLLGTERPGSLAGVHDWRSFLAEGIVEEQAQKLLPRCVWGARWAATRSALRAKR